MSKKLYRIEEEGIISGVCAGIAEYLNIDPTVIRLIAIVWSLTGMGLIVYIICSFIIPKKTRLEKNEIDV